MKKTLHVIALLLLACRAFAQVDVGATALVNPTSPQCGATNQTVIVTITNYSPATINFAVNNVTVNVSITGASIQTYNSPVINTGSLASGASMNVIVTNTCDLSAFGIHTFNSTTVNFSDVNNSNNFSGPIDILVNAPPTTANAGPDAGACTSSNLAGNTPFAGIGTWTLVSGSGTIASPNSPTSGITGLGAGPNTFVWTITNAPCPPSTDTVVITGPAPPTPASAGADQTFCAPNATLSGNTPLVGTGIWTLISGSGTIVSPASPTSSVTGLGVGPNTFRWTISNMPCPDSFDEVVITGDPAPTATLTSAPGSDFQTVCVNTAASAITYSIGGSATGATVTGLPAGMSGTFSAGTFTISGTPSAIGTFPYNVSTTGGTCPPLTVNGTITVNPDATITLTSGAPSAAQNVCVNNTLSAITYAIGGGGTGASVTGLPAGVTGSFAAGTVTISGTPTTAGTFNYTVTTTGSCTQVTANGTITVNPNATIALSSAAGTDTPSICVNTPLTAITFTIGGGGTGATVSGLPSGVTGSFAGGTYTISGTPATPGTYNYTVTTTGSCVQASASGTITVNPDATITLTSAPATATQSVCVNNSISTITYAIGGGGTGSTVSGLPAGVTGSFAAGTFTITGTPTTAGTFNYTVTTTGSCAQVTANGTIVVNPDATIALTSGAGSDAPTLCANTSLSAITYAINGGGTGATVIGLPAGLSGAYSAGTFTISGTATAAGTFNYTVTTTGTCVQTSANGTITVSPDATITLTSAPVTTTQSLCVNNAIANITYAIGGGGTGAAVSGLPAGVTGSFAAGTLTISGTPALAGTYNYTVTTTGTCAQVSATGTLTVNPDATIALTSGPGTDAQNVCAGGTAANITYAIGGGGTGASVTGLPVGMTGAYAAGVYTISGTPTTAGAYNYTVTTSGTCQQTTANGTITVAPNATVTLTSGAGTDAQTVCNNASITDITYAIGGSGTGAFATGLPAGVTGSFAAGTYTISGTPTTAGTFSYTVTSTGGSCPSVIAGGTITSSTQTLTLISAPFTNDQSICFGNTPVNIEYAVGGSGTGAGVSGLPAGMTASNVPTFGGTVFSISGTPTETGTFYYTVTTNGNCANASAIGSIYINPVLAGNTSGSDATICSGTTTTLGGGSVSGGDGNYAYLWESSPTPAGPFGPAQGINNAANYTTPVMTSSVPASWFRRIVTSGGCSDTALAVLVSVDSLPAAMAGGSATTCFDGTATVSGASAAAGTIAWSHDGAGTLLNASSASPTYLASSGDEGNLVTLTITVTSTNTCAPASATAFFTIDITPVPVATAGGTTTICANGGTATVPGASAANGTFSWSHDGQGALANASTLFPTYTAVPADAGDTIQLQLIVSGMGGCMSADTAMYTIIVNPIGSAFVSAGANTTISLGSSAELDATGPAIIGWSWFPATGLSDANIPDPVASPLATTTYTLTATDVNGCMAIDSLTITVEEDFSLLIANIVTPNGDTKNDTWIIMNIDNYPNTAVMIVNREGQLVYESDDYDNSWGGTYNGKLLPDGTYYYIVTFEQSGKVYKGAVNVLQN